MALQQAIAGANTADSATLGNILSTADGDVYPGRGPTENVFLGKPFSRLEMVGGQEIKYTCYSIVVLTLSPRDADDVKIIHRGPTCGNLIVTVEKWRLPDVLREHMVGPSSDQLFAAETDEEARTAFRESLLNLDGDVSDKMLVDVHLPNPILSTVRQLNPLHIEYATERSRACTACGLQTLYTTVPAAIFEVREIAHTTTGRGHV